jgi:hypothetical protein
VRCSKCGIIAQMVAPALAKRLAGEHGVMHNGPQPGRRR